MDDAGLLSNERRRAVLSHFLNGDIDCESAIITWVTGVRSRADVLAEFEEFVIPALVPAACPTLNRSRWLGVEGTFAWLGLLASHHNLLAKLMRRWKGTTDTASSDSIPMADCALWGGWASLASRGHDPSPPLPVQAAPSTNESDSEAEPSDFNLESCFDDEPNVFGPERIQDPITGDIDWKGMNKATIACAWAATSPGNKIILISIAWRPVLALMRDMIFLGSDKWERNEVLQASKGKARSYKVLELLFANSLKTFSSSLNKMFHQPCPALPPSAFKSHMRCLFFRILSRCGAATEQIYGAGLRNPPYPVFGALWGILRPFQSLPKCMYDEFHTWIHEQFPSEDGLLSAECQAILHTIAQQLDFDIVGVEARHASVRRLAMNKSLQTWAASLQDISSDWVCRQAVIQSEPFNIPRSDRAESEVLQGNAADSAVVSSAFPGFSLTRRRRRRSRPVGAKDSAQARNGPTKKKRGKRRKPKSRGGAWRAFVHEKYQGVYFTRSSCQSFDRIQENQNRKWT